MPVLISFTNANGHVGRCDATCYNAAGPKCDCICGGKNHGVGLTQARDNTAKQAALWMHRWEADHPDEPRLTVHLRRIRPRPPVTRLLFPDLNDPPPKAS